MNTQESGFLCFQNADLVCPEYRSCVSTIQIPVSVVPQYRPDVLGVVRHEECDSCLVTSHIPDFLGVIHHEETDAPLVTSHRPAVFRCYTS